MADDQPLLKVENLTTTFSTDNGTLTAVDGIDFSVDTGETVCIVGESGSGKTVATESITRIINTPPGEIEGTVRYDGRDLLSLPESELQNIRGNEIAHI
ncbi:ATP-binding cassette domain-containing protein, partial [Halorubrum ezzemoulense]